MADRAISKPEEEDFKDGSSNSIKVYGMQFAYEGQPALFADFNLDILPGSRCLLVGANGSGKQFHAIFSSTKHFLFIGNSFFVQIMFP